MYRTTKTIAKQIPPNFYNTFETTRRLPHDFPFVVGMQPLGHFWVDFFQLPMEVFAAEAQHLVVAKSIGCIRTIFSVCGFLDFAGAVRRAEFSFCSNFGSVSSASFSTVGGHAFIGNFAVVDVDFLFF